jgi:hypothetical protein
MKIKPLWALALPLLTLVSSFSQPICPEPLCWDSAAEWCAYCESGGGKKSESTALVNPPLSSINFGVDGNQCTNLKVQNLNAWV